MPELPEVETVKRGLEPVLKNTVIRRLTLHRPDLRVPFPERLSERLEGRCCLGLRRRGKYIWADFNNGETLVIHLGMSGSFTINPHKSRPHDHLVIETENGDKIVYNDPRRFGMFFIVTTGQEAAHSAFARMGPEPLGNEFNAPSLLHALKNRHTPVKVALLDQSVVAGIGNIYACEALYMAGISPLTKSSAITVEQANTLVTAIREVLNLAIASGGSSLRDHIQTDGTMGYFQHSFKVYGRAGETCGETGDIIQKIIQAGRSTFYCPAKQR